MAILVTIAATTCSSITAIESATNSFSVKKPHLQSVYANENHLIQRNLASVIAVAYDSAITDDNKPGNATKMILRAHVTSRRLHPSPTRALDAAPRCPFFWVLYSATNCDI